MPTPTKPRVISYALRERRGKPEVRAELRTLRGIIKERSLRFRVGYTAAMDFPLQRITGLQFPADLKARIAKQNAMASAFAVVDVNSPVGCASQSQFDWRTQNAVTGVRNQGGCGSCWDFAAIGAFEGSYAKRSGTLIDASEQDALDCNGEGGPDPNRWTG
jgi:cathepsin L